jgi:hypothetical protein
VGVEQLREQSFAVRDAPAADVGTLLAREATVTCIHPRRGTAVQRQSCHDDCTCDDR